jgi:AcrR family transcriptional regulator
MSEMSEMSAMSDMSESSAASTRQRILETAIEMIEQRGEAGLRVQELARVVGVGVTSIYRLFDSRDGLIVAAQTERYISILMGDLERFAAAAADCRSQDDVIDLVNATLDTLMRDEFVDQRMLRMNVVGSAQSRPELAEALRRAQAGFNIAFAEVLAPLQQRGWVQPDADLDALAPWLAGIVLSRTLIEFGESPPAGHGWNEITRRAVLAVMIPD